MLQPKKKEKVLIHQQKLRQIDSDCDDMDAILLDRAKARFKDMGEKILEAKRKLKLLSSESPPKLRNPERATDDWNDNDKKNRSNSDSPTKRKGSAKNLDSPPKTRRIDSDFDEMDARMLAKIRARSKDQREQVLKAQKKLKELREKNNY